MRLINFLLIFTALLLISCSSVQTQNRKERELQNKYIDYEILQISRNNNFVNLKLIVKVPINKLVFEKKTNYFESNLTLDVIVNDFNNKIIFSNSWNEKITRNYYDETKNLEKIILSHELSLEVGDYKINLLINDFENHINWVKSSDFSVEEQNGLSDINILYKENSTYHFYKDNTNIEDLDTLWIAFQISSPDKSNVKLLYEFVNNNTEEKIFLKDENDKKFDVVLFKEENKNASNKIVYKDEIEIKKINDEEVKYLPIPIIDDYFNLLKISLNYDGQIRHKSLNFNNVLVYQYDYSILFGPMYYLLQYEYVDFEELSNEDKWEFVEKYWIDVEKNKNDNGEMLKEFYKRTLYANENFKFLSTQGWDTDRGRIYIIHGSPDEIDHEFNNQGEFEIWMYKNNKKFIFINRYGYYELYQ